jgi:ribosomal protein S4E
MKYEIKNWEVKKIVMKSIIKVEGKVSNDKK